MAAKDLAKKERTSLRALVERGLTFQLADDLATRNDATLAPLIDRLIKERHRRLESGLRTMIARSAYEVIRTQYVLLNFITEAGIPPAKVSEWHKQGWRYAVKEFKRQALLDGDEDEG